MYYVIFAQDIPGTLEKRLAVREQHLARLKQLQAEGRPPHPVRPEKGQGARPHSGRSEEGHRHRDRKSVV